MRFSWRGPAWVRAPQVVAVALVLVLAATAFAFPATGGAGMASMLLVAVAGAVIAAEWPRISPALDRVPRWVTRLIAVAVVLIAGAALFAPAFDHPARYSTGDWGPHDAKVVALIAGLRHGHVPHWVQRVSTGASPFEMYPLFTSLLAAAAALAFHATHHVQTVLLVMAVIADVLIAASVTRIASRIAPWPLALLAGLVALFDRGNGVNGGSQAILHWALLHNAVAEVFALTAIVAVLDTLERPRLRSSVAIWIFTALATAAHPSALLVTAAAVVGLVIVALTVRDVRPHRPLIAAGHLLVGVGLGAAVWLPLSRRLLLYGVHYGTPQNAPWAFFARLIKHGQPLSTFVVVIGVGYVGIAAALLSRRARPTFVAATAATLFFGISCWPYVLLGLSPSPSFARLSSLRMLSLVKPLVFASAAYAARLVVEHARRRWKGARRPSRMMIGVGMALAVAASARTLIPFYYFQRWHSRGDAHIEVPDPKGFAQLIVWARQQAKQMKPSQFGRLLFDQRKNYALHVAAYSGLPTLYVGSIPDMFLREHIEHKTPASLHRFDVRWVVRQGRSPSLGDPSTERTFGSYHLRDVTNWDGKFARIERGHGTVTVTDLEDERVVVMLKSDAPALVALGTGFYPRWRVRSHGRAVPVYAYPAAPGSHAHVVAAWLPPGRSVFTPDGPLPSDGDGDIPALAALLIAGATEVVWSRRRWRVAALRRLAACARALRGERRRLTAIAAVGVTALVFAAGLRSYLRPARALKLGTGLFGNGAEVSLRHRGGHWHHCSYSRLRGGYACPGLGQVSDGTDHAVKDGTLSWKFPAPVIAIWPERQPRGWYEDDPKARNKHGPLEFRIRTRARLAGDYWLAARDGSGRVTIEGKPRPVPLGPQVKLSFHDRGRRKLVLSGVVGRDHMRIALVRIASLRPPRPFLVPPPARPPAAVVRLVGRR